MRRWVAGVDGCHYGWVVVVGEVRGDGIADPHTHLCPCFKQVLAVRPEPAVIVVDIPIGLLDKAEKGGRACDREARRLLGRPRASSVFSPPIRNQLVAPKRCFGHPRYRGLTLQAFHILSKIHNVDAIMTKGLQQRIYESHPEVAFASLTGRAMKRNKKRVQGREERLEALAKEFPEVRQVFERDRQAFNRQDVAPDDILDAYVMAWVAARVAVGKAEPLPANPPVDRRGLRMAIWRLVETPGAAQRTLE